jgi:hypothetical protein
MEFRRAAIVMIVLVSGVPALRAAPLEAAQCDQLKSEQDKLETQGVRKDYERGAQWGKTNLPAAKLEQVKRLISLDEQILFRCANPKPNVQLKEDTTPPDDQPPDEAVAAKKPAEKRKRGQAAAAAPAVAPPVPAAAAAPSVAEPAAAQPAPPAAGAKQQRAKARPKADDAFKPAPGTESVLTPPPGAVPPKQ